MRAPHLRQYAPAYLALGISLALVAGLAYSQFRAHTSHRASVFTQTVRSIETYALDTLDVHVNALHGVRGLFGASVSVEREEFTAFVAATGILRRLPALTRVGYATPARDPAGGPDSHGEPSAVIAYVEPGSAIAAAAPRPDLTRDADYRAAMRCVAATGAACASRAMTPSGAEDAEFAVLMPIYRKQAQPTELQGYAIAWFSLQRLAAAIAHAYPEVEIEIVAGARPATQRWRIQPDSVNRGLVANVGFDAYGRPWALRIGARAPFMARTESQAIDFIVIAGGALAAVLFLVLVMRIRSVAERQAQATALARQAHHDALTGLPNRYSLYEELQQRLQAADTAPLALLLIDLNGFKEINDTLGHNSGDAVLREMGRRLRATLRSNDTVARLGGDEFAVLIRERGKIDTERAAARLLQAIGAPFALAGLTLRIDASIGIAASPHDGNDVSTLLRCADVAMYTAKTGGHPFAYYNAGHDTHSERRLALISELGEAIAKDELVLHYQPIIELASGKVVSVEALVRWQHPRYGLIAPDQFIPIAEKSDIIKPLTRWVIKTAVRQLRAWRDAGFELAVAVNISARNLLDTELQPEIAAVLIDEHCEPRRLALEITETAVMHDAERSHATLSRLRELGIGIGIDDFGTGYSSLAYLKRLPAHGLKIDRSFIKDLAAAGNDVAIVRHTIELAHSLGMHVVAEGVETAETLAVLRRLGCSHAQGYHIARPMPAPQLTDWLRTRMHGFNTIALATTPRA